MSSLSSAASLSASLILPIPFINLPAQMNKLRFNIDKAIATVLDHGQFVMGPEVKAVENALSTFCGAKHVLSCSNGTDALGLCLRAMDVGEGDAIFVPSFTFAATAEVVAWMGATPVFVDVLSGTYNMDPSSLEAAIEVAQKLSLNPKGIIPVDLFGQPAAYHHIASIAEKHNLWILADAAQSFGATYKGEHVGTLGLMTTTSFFPAKPLGCAGDGGAVMTNDPKIYEHLVSLRVHGQAAADNAGGDKKYENKRIGVNARLDTLQAAILLEKLKVFPSELVARQRTADIYTNILKDVVTTPVLEEHNTSAWAQYTITLSDPARRSQIMQHLKEQGVPSVIYYPKPLNQQDAYKRYPTANAVVEQGKLIHTGELPLCEMLAQSVLSLPMSGYVTEDEAVYVAQTLKDIL